MIKTRNKVTFILACIFFAAMVFCLVLTTSMEVGYLEIKAERDALENDPEYDPEMGEEIGMGLSEGLSAAFSLIFGIIGAVVGAVATLFSALTIPVGAKWMKITAITLTAVAVLSTLWMFPGVLFIVGGSIG